MPGRQAQKSFYLLSRVEVEEVPAALGPGQPGWGVARSPLQRMLKGEGRRIAIFRERESLFFLRVAILDEMKTGAEVENPRMVEGESKAEVCRRVRILLVAKRVGECSVELVRFLSLEARGQLRQLCFPRVSTMEVGRESRDLLLRL